MFSDFLFFKLKKKYMQKTLKEQFELVSNSKDK